MPTNFRCIKLRLFFLFGEIVTPYITFVVVMIVRITTIYCIRKKIQKI